MLEKYFIKYLKENNLYDNIMNKLSFKIINKVTKSFGLIPWRNKADCEEDKAGVFGKNGPIYKCDLICFFDGQEILQFEENLCQNDESLEIAVNEEQVKECFIVHHVDIIKTIMTRNNFSVKVSVKDFYEFYSSCKLIEQQENLLREISAKKEKIEFKSSKIQKLTREVEQLTYEVNQLEEENQELNGKLYANSVGTLMRKIERGDYNEDQLKQMLAIMNIHSGNEDGIRSNEKQKTYELINTNEKKTVED